MTSRRRRSFDTVANARHPDIHRDHFGLDSGLCTGWPAPLSSLLPGADPSRQEGCPEAPYSPGPIVPRTPSVTGYLAPEISQAGSSAVQKVPARSGLSHDTRRHMVLCFQVFTKQAPKGPPNRNRLHIGHTAAISSRPGPPPRTKIQPASRSVEERLPVRTAFDSLEKMNHETQKRNCMGITASAHLFLGSPNPQQPFSV